MLRKYDALFILPVTLTDDDMEKAMQKVREIISGLNGTPSNMKILGKRTFARLMKKHDNGQYVKMQIDIEPDSIDALLAKLKLNEDVFRVQILRGEESPVPAAETAPEKENDNG